MPGKNMGEAFQMTGSFAVGWRQVAAAFLLMGTMAMIASSYSVLAVPFAREFGEPRAVLLLAMTALSLVSGALSPFLGSLMDRISLRLVMLAGSLLLAAGYRFDEKVVRQIHDYVQREGVRLTLDVCEDDLEMA